MKTDFNVARKLLAEAVRTSVSICSQQYSDQSLYAFAIVISNDFSSMMFWASTRELLAERLSNPDLICGKEMATLYFGNFDDEDVTSVEVSDAEKVLNQPALYEEVTYQASYLWACTQALRDAQVAGAFANHQPHVTAFCTMIDDWNAIWLEQQSAKFANEPDVYAAFDPEQKRACKEWFCKDTVEENDLQREFTRLMLKDSIPDYSN